MAKDKIRVVELFAGVGGFRIGLEGASDAYDTIWNNQWEPSTQHQDASLVYIARFGSKGHSNKDINLVPTEEIPDHDLLVGGFPCQDYSVAASLSRSGGIEGKKGVLWWQIHRILQEKGDRRPQYIFFENVDRLLNSPAAQRGRDFAIILASLADLGYIVEWRIINAADYGMPQRRRRTYILAYRNDSLLGHGMENPTEWIFQNGVFAHAFPVAPREGAPLQGIQIMRRGDRDLADVSEHFNRETPGQRRFENAGVMVDGVFYTTSVEPVYDGPRTTLGDIVRETPREEITEDFYISPETRGAWEHEKYGKREERVDKKTGFTYIYSEGPMAFPDPLDRPSRTIITGEGGSGASRFKHVIEDPVNHRLRRLVPSELEQLDMFPRGHTAGEAPGKRAFFMGNALVCGVVGRVGVELAQRQW